MRFFVGLVLALALGVMGCSGSDDGGLSPEALLINEYLDTYIEEHLTPDGPGFALAVVGPNNEIVLKRAHGVANRDEGLPIEFDTPFEVASVSKMFTATAILILYEDGLLELDDPISRFFPEGPASWEQITVHHLLTHLSGLPVSLQVGIGWTNEEVLDWYMDQPPGAEPGSEYVYNNGGYVLLALIVERASDQAFEDFLAERVFEPLAMQHSQIVDRFPPEVSGAALSKLDPSVGPPDLPRRAVGFSGQYSSIDDLMRWEVELRDATLISSESLELALSPLTGPPEPCGYGYGWVSCEYEGWPADVYHTGKWSGFEAMFYRAPSEGLLVVMVSNGYLEKPYRALGYNVAHLYLEGEIWKDLDEPCEGDFCDLR
jgi:CubicO group peptidase (beta-lactamase class C family)